MRIRVPATVANLGPGLDSLGVAVRLYLELDVAPDDEFSVSLEGEGSDDLPRDETNLIVRTMARGCEALGSSVRACALTVRNSVPLASGLGSSSAAVVAGLLAAEVVCGREMPRPTLLELAADIEGHPDNVAPAIFGGLVISYRTDAGTLRCVRLEPSERLVPIIAVPREGFATADARKALPATISLADAEFNASRAALVVAVLVTGDCGGDLVHALDDRIHQPNRLALMPDTAGVFQELRESGIPVALAGAGPSLLVVVDRNEVGPRTNQVKEVCASLSDGWRVFVSDWELGGAITQAL